VKQAVFRTQEEAVEVLWHFMVRMGSLIMWVIIAILHLAAGWLLLAALWYWKVQSEQIAATLHAWSESNAIAVASAFGVSLLTIGWAYWRLARWAHQSAGTGLVFRYLTKGLRRE
jgi:hypothetical protein